MNSKSCSSTLMIGALAMLAWAPMISGHDHHRVTNDNDRKEFVELSHIINNQTFQWIYKEDRSIYRIMTKGGKTRDDRNESNFVTRDRLDTDVYSSTYMDAPNHFANGKWSTEQVPLDRLVNVPAVVIDVSRYFMKNSSYKVIKDHDIISFEDQHRMKIPLNSIVLFYTGRSQRWRKEKEEYFGGYMGTEFLNEPENLVLSGLNGNAAKFLVNERHVVGVGIDSPSIDAASVLFLHGNMKPEAQQIFNSANVYTIKNINNNLKKFANQTNVQVTLLPLRIESGWASPVRMIARSSTSSTLPTPSANSWASTLWAPSVSKLIYLQLILAMITKSNLW